MLRETITLWNEAVMCYDQGEFDKALTCLEKVSDPTAKILFDIGCAHLSNGSPNNALESFARTIQKDEHLAVGYFQHGVAAFKVNRISDALDSFQKAYFYMRGHSVIDYRQLGLTILLYASQVLLNLSLCWCRKRDKKKALRWLKDAESLESTQTLRTAVKQALACLQRGEEHKLEELPLTAIFRPAKSAISSLEKKNFLGQAKVVAALDQTDTFTGFAGPRKHSVDSTSSQSPPPRRRNLSRQNSKSLEDLSVLREHNRRSPRGSPNSPKSPANRPPPPSIPPPKLPNRKFVLVQRTLSRSSENLLPPGASHLPAMRTPNRLKTDLQNRHPRLASTPLHTVTEVIGHDNRGIPSEAPKRAPPDLPVRDTVAVTRVHGHRGDPKRTSNVPGVQDKNLQFTTTANRVLTNRRSDIHSVNPKDDRSRNIRKPPSRPPPQYPPPNPHIKKTPAPAISRTTVAVYSYTPGEEGQLDFGEGEIINVEEEVDENWFQGRLRGKTGLVPWIYVKRLTRQKDVFH